MESKILGFIARIIHETRQHPSLCLGASPRAFLATADGVKAVAVMNNRYFVITDDVTKIAPAVLCHRIMLNRSCNSGRIGQIIHIFDCALSLMDDELAHFV